MLKHLLATALLLTPLVHAGDVAFTVSGEVKTPLKLSLAEVEAMPAQTISVKDHDGTTASYEGVPLEDILIRPGVPHGDSLRSDALRLCVLANAADGYKAVFTLAELDPHLNDKTVLMAYRRNGNELDTNSGPLRLVIPGEKHQMRWVHQVTGLETIRIGGGREPRSGR
jgi:DMSO/TMAO reductase YedYZ molybdopterin-dependent catalytic subunit